ncbi:hypothetical protein BJV77DRAFT_1131266 [Russula vinacea]|nr:hypothetical protein BJV77DRAFT_1131266 [Russula vinacea]
MLVDLLRSVLDLIWCVFLLAPGAVRLGPTLPSSVARSATSGGLGTAALRSGSLSSDLRSSDRRPRTCGPGLGPHPTRSGCPGTSSALEDVDCSYGGASFGAFLVSLLRVWLESGIPPTLSVVGVRSALSPPLRSEYVYSWCCSVSTRKYTKFNNARTNTASVGGKGVTMS